MTKLKVQTPCKGPPRMRSKLPGWTASSLCASSRLARQWRKLYRAISFRSVQSSLAVRKFRVAGKERCERGHGRVCANLWCLMSWHPKRNRSYVRLSRPTFGFTTQEFSMVGGYTKNLKTVKFGGGRLLGYGCLLWYGRLLETIRQFSLDAPRRSDLVSSQPRSSLLPTG